MATNNNFDFGDATVMVCPRCNHDKVKINDKHKEVVQCKKCFHWFTLAAAKYMNYFKYYNK